MFGLNLQAFWPTIVGDSSSVPSTTVFGKRTLCAVLVFSIFGTLAGGPLAGSVLGTGELLLAGTELRISPETQTVPLDLPTVIETELVGFDPIQGTLPPGLRVVGSLTGPEITGALELQTAPNEPFRIPRFRLEGEYVLDNIRLVDGDDFLAWATPSRVTLNVTQVLVTSVESRPLTMEEIQSLGLVIDENRYQALSLTFGFAVSGRTINYSMPVVYDLFGSGPDGQQIQPFPAVNVPLPEFGGGTLPPSGRFRPQLVPFKLDLKTPQPPEIPHGGCSFNDKECRERFPPSPPMVGVILFPTDLRLLHQFFSVVLFVQNGAPEGDPLVIRDLAAKIKLPAGLREAATEPPTPLGVPVPVRVAGADGEVGTADDINLIIAQAKGEANFEVEGLREGTHVVEFDLEGIVDGLPGGAQRIVGKAKGAVVVRDPNLGVTIHHPMTVRSGEEYPLKFTISNTGNTIVNGLSIELPASGLSGSELVDPYANVQTVGELLPGDAATVEFPVRALRTGRVVSTSVRTGSQTDPHWEFSLGVGAGGVLLSPDALVLPQASQDLPAGLLDAALRVIGLGHSLSVTPQAAVGGNLPRLGKATVNERIYRVTQAGRHLQLGEDVFDTVATLAAELYGARDQDFDWNLLMQRVAGARGLATELGNVLRAEVSTTDELFERLAKHTHFLEPQLAIADGTGATLEVASRVSGKALYGAPDGPDPVRGLPFGELFGFADGQLALLTVPETDGYRFTLRVPGGGSAGLRVLAPTAAGALRTLNWANVSLDASGSAWVDVDPADTSFVLQIDANGDGFPETTQSAQLSTLTPRPFEAVAVRQNADIDPSGHVLDVLFTADVDLASLWPQDDSHFVLPNNVSNGGLMPVEEDIVAGILGGTEFENPFEGLFNSRLVRVIFSNPVSPLDSHTLTISDLASTAGQPLSHQTMPVETTASLAGIRVEGQVIGPDGEPVPYAEVILRESDLAGVGNEAMCTEHVTAATQADGNGYYRFPYVRHTACGDVFTIIGRDLVRHKRGSAKGRVRFHGTTQELDVLMLGRGTLRGRVTYPDGTVPPGLQVLAENPVFDDGRRAWVDADGNYNIAGMAVGTIQLVAHDEQGNFAYATVELPVAGAVVDKDIVLLDPEEERWTGQLRGTVVGLDDQPVSDAWVALYVGGQLIKTLRSDGQGDFDFGVVPATTDDDPATVDPGVTAEIEAFPSGSSVSGAQLFLEIRKDQINEVEVRLSDDRATVEGHIWERSIDGSLTPLVGAPVWVVGLPFNTVTDANGHYRLEDIFAGNWTIKAADIDGHRHGQTTVSVGAANEAVADIYFDEGLPEGGVTGRVVDYDGVTPVAGATVHLTGGVWAVRWYHEAITAADGTFSIPGVGPGQFWVSAVRGDDGGLAPFHVRFPGDTPTVEVKFRKGTIRVRTVAVQEDGSTAPVCSTILGRTTTIVPKFGYIVAVDDKFRTHFTCPMGGEATEEFVEIEALEGPYQLHVYNSFHGTRRISRYLGDGEIAEHVIEFQPNGSVGGVIYDIDGTPVEGATVELTSPPPPLYAPPTGPFAAYDLQTDENGRFLFELVPKGIYDLTVTYDDGPIFRKGRMRVRLARAGEHLEVEMELPKQGSVIGWVQDGAGLPVAGAVVELSERAFPHRRLVHNADELGNFAFHNVFVGEVSIRAQVPSLGGLATTKELVVEAENQDVYTVMTLDSVGEVTGQVIYPGGLGPAAGSRVELHAGGFFDVVTADANGEFRFRLLPVGTQFHVQVFDPSTGRFGKGDWVALDYHGQVKHTEVTLEARGEVHGAVIDDEIAAGVPATPVRLRSRGLRWFSVYASTDADGNFEFGGIPEGDFELHVQAGDAGRRRVATEIGVLREEDEIVTVDLRLTSFATIGGQVFNPPGSTGAGSLFSGDVNTWISRGDSLVVGATFENPFEFSGIVPRQSYRVTAQEVAGPHRVRSGYLQVSENDADGRVDVDLVMPAIGSATISVVDSFGNPVPHAEVKLRNVYELGDQRLSGNTGNDHRITFNEQIEGSIRVSATDPATGLKGSNSARLELEGEDVDIQVTLQASGTVQGRVLLADGVTPAEGAVVSVFVDAWGKYFLTTADENGDFDFEGLPMSTFGLSVQEHFGPGSIERFSSLTSNGQVRDFGTLVLDDRDPHVVSIEPATGSRDVLESAVLTITFSEPIHLGRFSSSDIRLEKFSGAAVGKSISWSADGTTATLDPTGSLASATSYVLRVTRSIVDEAGRHLAWEQRASFTTRDYIRPTVIDIVPRNNAVQVPVDSTITVRFSEPIDESVMPTFELFDITSGSPVAQAAIPQRASELRYVVTPGQLLPDRRYRVDVSAAQDVAGNVMSGTVSTTFWSPDETPPEIVWVSPDAGSTYTAGDDIAAEVTATDNRGMDRVEYAIGDWTFVATSGTDQFISTLLAPVMSVAGNVEITATAIDIFGNQTVITRTVWVEPHVNGEAPVVDPGCWYDGDYVAPGLAPKLDTLITDDERIESYAFFVDGVELDRVTPVNAASASKDFVWQPPWAEDAPPGTSFLLRVEARDFAGNVGFFEATMSVPADGPLLRADQILNPVLYTGQPVYLADGEFLIYDSSLPFQRLTLLRQAVVRTEDAPGLDRVLDLQVDTSLTLQCGSRIEADSVNAPDLFTKQGAVLETPQIDVATLTSEGLVDTTQLMATTAIDVTSKGVVEAATLTAPDLLIGDRGVVRAGAKTFDVMVSGTLTIEPEARLDGSADGYAGGTAESPAGQAPSWVSASQNAAGGSHGGVGTTYRNPHYADGSQGPPGEVYGSVYLPHLAGAGGAERHGPGGAGGAFVSVEAGSLVLDGEIASRGESFTPYTDPEDPVGGGGAGGSVAIRTGLLSGSGRVDVSGGTSDMDSCDLFWSWPTAGAGGGGRVAIHGTAPGALSGFDPATQARAWGGWHGCQGTVKAYAAPGTVLVHRATSTYGDLWIDSGTTQSGAAREGFTTELPTLGSGAIANLEAQGADAWLTGAQTLRARWLGVWVTLSDSGGSELGEFRVLELDASGRALLEGAAAVVGSASTYRGDYQFDQLYLRNGANVTSQDSLAVPDVVFAGGNVGLGSDLAADNLTVGADTKLFPLTGSSLRLTVTETLTVEVGGRIDVSGRGYEGAFRDFDQSGWPDVPAEAPPWVQASVCASGGSHGGGGNFASVGGFPPNCTGGPAGDVYGSVYEPSLSGGGGVHNLGSSVLGGDGGGILIIDAASLVLDGELLAMGESVLETDPGSGLDSPAGAGAGGSILLRVGELSGTGRIDATGGDQDMEPCANTWDKSGGGAGGGGRVGLYVETLTGFDPATQVSAWGGYRGCHGNAEGYAAPGTVLVHTPESTYGSLRVDAGPKLAGAAGSVATFLPTLGSGAAVATEVDVADLWLTGDSDLWPRWDGAWVSLADAGGADLGLFQVVARDAAGRLRLADAASAVAAATYQGRYLFDSIEVLRGADLTAEEPIESGAVTFDGVTEITGEVVAIDVLVKSGATVRPAAGGDLRFQVSGTMTIEAGAKLDVSGKGYRGTTTDRYDPAGAPSWVTASKCGAGGSHGGRGSIYGYWECSFGPAGDVYGSVYEPWLSGGGGAMVNNDDGGDGGGRIYIEAGALILDGEVLARGEGLDAVDVEAGGGAGGSVQIHTGELSGSGLVDASGGNNIQVCVNFNDWSSAGAGGGGRVGLYADTLNGFDPATQVRAWGGYHGCPGALQYAAPGTILTVTSESTYGDLLIDAGSKPGGEAAVHSTFLPTLGSGDVALAEVDGADLWLTSDSDLWPRWLGAWVSLADAAGESLGLFQVTDRDVDGRLRLAGAAAATTAVTYRGHYVFDSVEVLAGADLTATEPIEAGSVTFDGVAEITGEVVAVDVLVKSGATVRPASGSNLSFKVSGTMTVEAGAKIDVTGYGYEGAFRDFSISGWPNVPAEAPPWVTPSVCASGGSHGGAGNFKNVGGFSPNCTWGPAGEVYGSVYEPSLGGGGGVHNLGSSVLGGDGGGTITIEAGALVLDGELRARGQSVMETDSGSGTDSPAGAGAGGSVLLQVGQLSGAGLIDVTGGDQDQEPCANTWDQKGGGAGGGGRVGIYADDLSGFDTASQVKAWGGYRGCYGNAEGYAAAGTILVFTPESTHGGLRIDAGPQAQGSATTVKTWLPNPGIDTMVEFEVAGNDAWLTGTKVFHPRWVGATTHLMDAAGETLGRFWVIRIDADGRALLQDAATAIAQTVSYEGEYWFDTFELGGGAGWNSSAPVFVMDEQVSLAETELSVAEDDAAGAIFTVTLPEASTLDISIDYTTVDGTAIAGDDYVATSGTVVIPAGQLSAPVTVDLIADLVHEPAETFELELTAATPGLVVASAARATLTIQNDDVFSQVTVGDRFVVEPETGSRVSAVRVTLDPPAAEQITVDYQTAGGTATPSVDFTPVTGTLTFEAGESSKTIGVDILANSEQESAEAFWLDLTAVTRAELADARAEITIYDGQTPVPDAPHAAGFLVDYEEDAYHIVQENPSWEQYNGGALWNHKTIAKVGAGDRLRLRTRPELLRTDHKLVLGVLNDRWNGFSISVGDWTSPVRYNSQHRSPEFHDEIEITIPRDVITDETFEVTFTPGGNNTYTSAYLTSFKLYAATDDQDFQRGVNYYWAGTGWAWHSGEWNRKRMASLNHGTSGTIPMTTSSPDDGHVFYLTTVDDRASAFRIQVGSWTSGVVAAPQDGGSPFVELAIDIPAGTIPGESFDVTVVNETLDTAFVGKLHAIEVRLVRKGNGSALVDYEDDAYQISQDTDCVLYSSNLWNGRTMCKGKRSEVSTGATLNLQTRPEHLLSDHQLILGTLNNRWEGWQITVNGWTSPVRYNSQHMSPAVHEDLVLTIPGYVVTSTELDVQLTPGSNNTFTNHYITHYRLIANTGDQDLQRGVTFHWADGWDWRGDEWNRKRLAKANAEEGSEKISMTTSDPADAHLFYFTTLDDRDSSVQIQVGSWTSEWVTAPQDGGSPFVELAIEIPANTIPATDFEVTVIDGTTDNDGKLHLTEVRLVRLPEPPAAPTAELSVGPTASATEGDPAGMIFDVTLSEPTLVDVAIDYVLRDDTALAGVDYQPTSGLMTLPAGQTSAQIVVPLIANTTIEPHRTFELELTAASSAVLGATLAVATLLDDDRPNLSIGDAVVTEPTTGSASVEVALTLDAAPVFEVTVSYQTVDGTAVAGEDYTTQTGSLTFAPGETSQTISLTVLADGIAEPAEAFNVTLGVPSEAVLLDGDGEVSVLDSGDAPPVAAFTVDCSGLRCTFDASGSTDDVGIATYSWDFGDGTQLSTAEAIVEHRLPAVLGGQFTIQLTVIDDGDQQAGATQDITVISLEQLLPLLTH